LRLSRQKLKEKIPELPEFKRVLVRVYNRKPTKERNIERSRDVSESDEGDKLWEE